MATAAAIPLHGPFCDAAQELYATSTAFGSSSCVVRPILPDDNIGDFFCCRPLCRRGVPPHLLDTYIFGAAYFATYIACPWPLLDVSPTMWAHAPSMPLAMFIVRDVVRRMCHLRAADKVDGYTAGWGCFPKAWEPTGDVVASPAEQQERRRRRQFAHDGQPRPYRFTYYPPGNLDVDEDLIVASLVSAAAPLVAATLQLPSGMVLRARVRQ